MTPWKFTKILLLVLVIGFAWFCGVVYYCLNYGAEKYEKTLSAVDFTLLNQKGRETDTIRRETAVYFVFLQTLQRGYSKENY